MSVRTIMVRTLGIALVSLLLCAIFASELPELLSLTDNTTNDFTVRNADSLFSPFSLAPEMSGNPPIEFNNSAQDPLVARMGSPEKTELALCLFILYSAQRV
jgi:hypothetical protein